MNALMDDTLKEKISKRGYAYRCRKCHIFKGEKRYVETHIYKFHVALDEVPYYCSLCHFMAKTEKEVTKHTRGYKPHKQAEERLVEEGKPVPDSSVYIHRNNVPIEIGDEYMEKMSLEESQLVWISRMKTSATATATATATTSATASATVPDDDIAQLPELTATCNEQEVPELPALLKPPETVTIPVGPVLSLPDIDLPETTEGQEYDILQNILADENVKAAEEFPEEEEPRTRSTDSVPSTTNEILLQILGCLKDLKKETESNGRLLTMLNTGLRKNTMAMDALTSSMRANERNDRNERWRASPCYRRPQSVVTIPRRRTETKRRKSPVRKLSRK